MDIPNTAGPTADGSNPRPRGVSAEMPTRDESRHVDREGSRSKPGDRVGPYTLLELIGEGGFGTVWLAERREPMVQRVAVKIIKPGMDSKAVVARFEQERQALAVMDHPNVAKVFDGGVTERGLPYFVMEHVAGEPITNFCDRHRYTIRQRLELFISVCDAVQHAHMKGIIHRDLKPSNVLVSNAGGASVAKVIDFGVAKAISQTLTEKTIYTETGQMIGTPEYMSPEQAEMGRLDVDTRTDVYSLGVLLYELLAGVLPFDADRLRAGGYAAIQRVLREEDAPRPSTRLSTIGDAMASRIADRRQHAVTHLSAVLRRELDWIPLKAMRKDRVRRYSSAESLAADIRRYLDGRPLEAAPESRRYRLGKLIRRNAGAVAALTLVVLSIGVGVGIALVQRDRAIRSAADAARARDTAASKALEADAAAQSARHQEARTRSLYLLDQRLLPAALEASKEAYRLGGGRWADAVLLDRVVRECQASWQLEIEAALSSEPTALRFVFAEGSPLLAVGTRDEVRFLSLASGEWTRSVTLPVSAQHMAFLSAGDGVLAVAGEHAVVMVDLKSWTLSKPTTFPSPVVAIAAGTGIVALTLADKSAWTLDADGVVLGTQVWPPTAVRRPDQHLLSIDVSPDDRFVLFGGHTFTSDRILWDRTLGRTSIHGIRGNSFVFADNTTVFATAQEVDTPDIATWWYRLVPPASAEQDTTLTPVERGEDFIFSETGAQRSMFVGPTSAVMVGEIGVGIVPRPRADAWAGRRDLLASSDRYGNILGIENVLPSRVAASPNGRVIAISDAKRLLIFGRSSEQSGVWYTDRNCVTLIGGDVLSVDLNARLQPVVRVTRSGTPTAFALLDLASIKPLDPARTVYFNAIQASGDASTVAIRHLEHSANRRYVDPPTGHAVTVARRKADAEWNAPFENLLTIRLGSPILGERGDILVSPRGDRLLVYGGTAGERTAFLYDTADGSVIQRWRADGIGALITASTSSEVFVDADEATGVVRVRAWATGSVVRSVDTKLRVNSLSQPPDGRTLVVSSAEGLVREFALEDGAPVREFRSDFRPAAWSPDRSLFIGASGHGHIVKTGTVALVDGRDGSLIAVLQRGLDDASDAMFTPDSAAFLAPGQPNVKAPYVLMRRVTPEFADRVLRESRVRQTLTLPLDPSGIQARESSGDAPLPLSDGALRTSQINISAIGQSVTVEDLVTKVTTTRNRSNFMVFFGDESSRFMLFIPEFCAQQLRNTLGDDLFLALEGKNVRVRGNVTAYGGRDARYADFQQIVIEQPDQITVLDPKRHSTPPSR